MPQFRSHRIFFKICFLSFLVCLLLPFSIHTCECIIFTEKMFVSKFRTQINGQTRCATTVVVKNCEWTILKWNRISYVGNFLNQFGFFTKILTSPPFFFPPKKIYIRKFVESMYTFPLYWSCQSSSTLNELLQVPPSFGRMKFPDPINLELFGKAGTYPKSVLPFQTKSGKLNCFPVINWTSKALPFAFWAKTVGTLGGFVPLATSKKRTTFPLSWWVSSKTRYTHERGGNVLTVPAAVQSHCSIGTNNPRTQWTKRQEMITWYVFIPQSGTVNSK